MVGLTLIAHLTRCGISPNMHVELFLTSIIRQYIPNQLLCFEFLDWHEGVGSLNVQKFVHNASEFSAIVENTASAGTCFR